MPQSFFDYFRRYYIELGMGINYPIQMALFCLTITLSMNTLKWDKKGILLRILDAAITFLLQVFFFSFFEFLFGSHNYINYISWPFVVLIHCFFFTKEPFFDRIAKGLVLLIFIILLPQLNSNIISVLGKTGSEHFSLFSILLTFFFTSLWSAFFLFLQAKRRANSKVSILSFLILLFSLGFSLALIVTDNTEQRNQYLNNVSHLFLYILLMCISIVTYSLFCKANVYHTSSYESERMALRLDADKRMVNLSRENLNKLRRLRHDTKNQYQFMKMLIDNGEYQKLKEFCSEMMKQDIEISDISTRNPIIDSLIKEEKEVLKKERIFLEISSSSLLGFQASKEELSPFFQELEAYLIQSADSFINEDLSLHGENLYLRLDFKKKETDIPMNPQLKSKMKDSFQEEERQYLTFVLR